MLTILYTYKIQLTPDPVAIIDQTFKGCCQVWNSALKERKDWINSPKFALNSCSIHSEYILSSDELYSLYNRQANNLTEAKKSLEELATVKAQVIHLEIEELSETSDRELIKRPRFFANLYRKLRWLPTRLKHKEEGSNNRNKLIIKSARIYKKINNTCKEFYDKLAHHLWDNAGMIFAVSDREAYTLPLGNASGERDASLRASLPFGNDFVERASAGRSQDLNPKTMSEKGR